MFKVRTSIHAYIIQYTYQVS